MTEIFLRDEAYMRKKFRPWVWLLRHVFRLEIVGFDRLTPGPYFFVANHNIGAGPETRALLNLFLTHPEWPPLYPLAHPSIFKIRSQREFITRVGCIPASFEAAAAGLARGGSLLVYPGGNKESFRPFTERNRCDLGGRKGWAKIALDNDVRVVPVSISGSHSVNPVLLRSRWLSAVLVLPRRLGIKYFPITASQLIWSKLVYTATKRVLPKPLAAAAGVAPLMVAAYWPCWPAKITIRFGDPVDLVAMTADAETEQAKMQHSYDFVSTAIQDGMDRSRESS